MSRIEELIGEIEEYIDSCKYQPLSSTKILVNKEEMEELLVELRLRVPDEIKKYQRIISQQDVILSEAQNKADAILADAQNQTNAMVSEHAVMQEAQASAQQIVNEARMQAEQILNSANAEAMAIRTGAIKYTDDMLASLQTIISHSMEGAKGRFDAYLAAMQNSYDIVSSNRRELNPDASAEPAPEL